MKEILCTFESPRFKVYPLTNQGKIGTMLCGDIQGFESQRRSGIPVGVTPSGIPVGVTPNHGCHIWCILCFSIEEMLKSAYWANWPGSDRDTEDLTCGKKSIRIQTSKRNTQRRVVSFYKAKWSNHSKLRLHGNERINWSPPICTS